MLCFIYVCIILSNVLTFAYSNSNATTITAATVSPSSSTQRVETRISAALRDIAYYLRAYKFNEYDRRYVTDATKGIREYYRGFPRPPLRILHWEVERNCEPSFHGCVEFLWKKVKLAGIKRDDDTSVIVEENKWFTVNNTDQIRQVNEECKKMRAIDDVVADPFEGPLERFQWRVTASYYMCMYTMMQTEELKHLNEPSCDNHADCLEEQLGPHNKDPRADDSKPFACALYSFCPDPCCSSKHLTTPEQCWDNPDNPCARENPSGHHRKCSITLDMNTDFSDIVLNRWNVTCRCPQKGFEWSSLYGMCVDVDECTISGGDNGHNCDRRVEACVNLPGSFRCVCKWGHIFSEQQHKCAPSAALEVVMLEGRTEKQQKVKRVSVWRTVMRFIFKPPNGACKHYTNLSLVYGLVFVTSVLIV